MGVIQDFKSASRLGVLVAVAAATVGMIYGYDSSNIGGALLYLEHDFDLDSATAGWVASIVVIGEIVGALCGGALADRVGRKKVMVGVAATFAAFSLLSGLAWDVSSLMAARFLLGLTIGVSVVVVPVFVAESAATKIRGALLVMYQVATVTGIIFGYLDRHGARRDLRVRERPGRISDLALAARAGSDPRHLCHDIAASAPGHRPLVPHEGPPRRRREGALPDRS